MERFPRLAINGLRLVSQCWQELVETLDEKNRMKQITCLINNTVQQGSPFWGEHGLSFLIETGQGRLLFDTGQTAAVLLHNLALVGLSTDQIEAVVLSHAHNDHTGGLPALLSRRPGLAVYASPDIGRPRYSRKEERYAFIGLPVPMAALAHQAELHLDADPVEVLPGLWTTGEIKERLEPEGRSPNHVVPHQDDDWQPDPYRDDMSMVMETGEGLVLICGCCHAGLLNTLAHVEQTFQGQIMAVLGGSHLVSAEGTELQRVVEVLANRYGPLRFYPNHCTGQRAYVALAAAFGDRVQPYPAGLTLTFE
jgi:7,8-dihydropterin-6-yl-methyl-4-(beta-D-ribofuranosyl)aminobenzene 5'-phosphate synthase